MTADAMIADDILYDGWDDCPACKGRGFIRYTTTRHTMTSVTTLGEEDRICHICCGNKRNVGWSPR